MMAILRILSIRETLVRGEKRGLSQRPKRSQTFARRGVKEGTNDGMTKPECRCDSWHCHTRFTVQRFSVTKPKQAPPRPSAVQARSICRARGSSLSVDQPLRPREY